MILFLTTIVLFGAPSTSVEGPTTAEKDRIRSVQNHQKDVTEEVPDYQGIIRSVDQESGNVTIQLLKSGQMIQFSVTSGTTIQFFSRRKILMRTTLKQLKTGMKVKIVSDNYYHDYQKGKFSIKKHYLINYMFIN